MAALGGDLFVRKATLEYQALGALRRRARRRHPLRARRHQSSLRFAAGVFRGEELLVHGELVYVWTPTPPRRRPQPVPAALRDAFRAHEAGEPMVERARSATGTRSAPRRRRSAPTVFVDEQRIPAEIEWDDADAGAVHAVARNRLGQAVATGRLLAGDGAGHPARIGRMAVQPRRCAAASVGRAVLEALMAAAGERGDREVMLHAQVTAIGFYRAPASRRTASRFEEAGIGHRRCGGSSERRSE